MKHAASLGSGCSRLEINISTGRSFPCGFARFWKWRIAFRIGWSRFSTAVCLDFSKAKKTYPKRPRAGLCLCAWKIGLMPHFRHRKAGRLVYAMAKKEIREPRYQRAEVCWSECVERWKKAKPIQYPSFDEWRDAAAHCDEPLICCPR